MTDEARDCGCQPARSFVCPPHQIAALEAELEGERHERHRLGAKWEAARAEVEGEKVSRESARADADEYRMRWEDARAELHEAKLQYRLWVARADELRAENATLRGSLGSILVFAVEWEETGAIEQWPQIEWQRALARIAEFARARLDSRSDGDRRPGEGGRLLNRDPSPARDAPVRSADAERADVVAYGRAPLAGDDVEVFVGCIARGEHEGAAARRADSRATGTEVPAKGGEGGALNPVPSSPARDEDAK